jgi:uncharacterized coiled-coil protein SlyX
MNLLLAGKPEGTFLVREHDPASSKYALSVVYNGKPTHHKVTAREGEAGVIGEPLIHLKTGESTLPVQGITAIISHLRSTHPYWPIALTAHIPGTAAWSCAPVISRVASQLEATVASQQQQITGLQQQVQVQENTISRLELRLINLEAAFSGSRSSPQNTGFE